MKKTGWSRIVLLLCILSLAGVAFLVVRDMMRTPADYFQLAQEQIRGKKYRSGVIYLLRAAKGNMPEANYQLALLYDVGDKIPENKTLAVDHMKRAADSGLAEAQYALAVWTERGYLGAADPTEAIRLYEKAAQKGHQNAMKTLIVLYGGTDKIPANPEKQAYWMEKLKGTGK